MSQLTYNLNPAAGRAGMIADDREGTVVISRIAEGAVPVGLLCQRGTNSMGQPSATTASSASTSPGQCKAFVAGGGYADPLITADVLGVPLFDSSRAPYDSSDRYADEDPVMIMRKGPVWVAVLEAVAEGAQAYVWVNPGGGDPTVGTFAAGAHAGKAVKVPGAEWGNSTSGAGLAILNLNLI